MQYNDFFLIKKTFYQLFYKKQKVKKTVKSKVNSGGQPYSTLYIFYL